MGFTIEMYTDSSGIELNEKGAGFYASTDPKGCFSHCRFRVDEKELRKLSKDEDLDGDFTHYIADGAKIEILK